MRPHRLTGSTPTLIAVAVLAAACSTTFAPVARAGPVQYTITFTALDGTAPTAGAFFYDSSATLGSRFSNFLVTWNSATFNLKSSANSPQESGSDCVADAFALLSGNGCAPQQISDLRWAGSTAFIGVSTFEFISFDPSHASHVEIDQASLSGAVSETADGNFSIGVSPTGAPEPGNLILVLAGGCCCDET